MKRVLTLQTVVVRILRDNVFIILLKCNILFKVYYALIFSSTTNDLPVLVLCYVFTLGRPECDQQLLNHYFLSIDDIDSFVQALSYFLEGNLMKNFDAIKVKHIYLVSAISGLEHIINRSRCNIILTYIYIINGDGTSSIRPESYEIDVAEINVSGCAFFQKFAQFNHSC